MRLPWRQKAAPAAPAAPEPVQDSRTTAERESVALALLRESVRRLTIDELRDEQASLAARIEAKVEDWRKNHAGPMTFVVTPDESRLYRALIEQYAVIRDELEHREAVLARAARLRPDPVLAAIAELRTDLTERLDRLEAAR